MEHVGELIEEFVRAFQDLRKKAETVEAEVRALLKREAEIEETYTGLRKLLEADERESRLKPLKLKREDANNELARCHRQLFQIHSTKFWDILKAVVRRKLTNGEAFETDELLLLDYGFCPGLSPADLEEALRADLEETHPVARLVHQTVAEWIEFALKNPQKTREWMDSFESLRAAVRSATDGMFYSALLGTEWTRREQAARAYQEVRRFDRRFREGDLPLLMVPYDGENGGVLYSKRRIEAIVVPVFGAKPVGYALVTGMAALRKEEEVRSFIDQVDTYERERRREEARMTREDLAAVREREQKFKIEIMRERRKSRLRGPLEKAYLDAGLGFESFEEFAERFISDYVLWMTSVVKGSKTLAGASYRVFKENIGPRWDELLDEPDCPGGRPTPEAAQILLQKYRSLAESRPSQVGYYNLALLSDVFTHKKDRAAARELYRKAEEIDPHSLWALYAHDRANELSA
ncbi:MAG: hypothetical protein HYY13_03150 [Nitrospirae bacterium]|nr:hypothetical protein [Nitrospirota bacterium]